MKNLLLYTVLATLIVLNYSYGQLTITNGTTPHQVYVLPFTSTCVGGGTVNATAITVTATFKFNSTQCCACPTSGSICLPGSVAYGGTGSSGQFTYYHTLSYSSTDEHQQLLFSAPVKVFRFSTSGPASAAGDAIRADVYNGATLLGSFNIVTAGQGALNKFTIVHTGSGFTRVAFVETGAINADDELLGDFFISDQIVVLGDDDLNLNAAIIDSRNALLTWNGLNQLGATSYILEESKDGVLWDEIKVQENMDAEFYTHQTSIESNVQYYYRLTALDNNNNILANEIRDLLWLSDEIKVFPNPTQDRFYVRGNNKLDLTSGLTIIDVLGKEIKLQSLAENGETYFSTAHLSSGIYMIQELNQKLIIEH